MSCEFDMNVHYFSTKKLVSFNYTLVLYSVLVYKITQNLVCKINLFRLFHLFQEKLFMFSFWRFMIMMQKCHMFYEEAPNNLFWCCDEDSLTFSFIENRLSGWWFACFRNFLSSPWLCLTSFVFTLSCSHISETFLSSPWLCLTFSSLLLSLSPYWMPSPR